GGTMHVRGVATCRQADSDVVRTDDRGRECPAVLRILGILNCAEERVRTAGDMGDHPPLRQVEGRDELRGVEDREPARGSRAEVMDPATPAETVDGDVNERSKILEHLRDGVDGDAVVLVEEPE